MITPKAFELFEVLIDEYGTGEVDKINKAHWLNQAIRDYIEDHINPRDDRKGYSFNVDNRMRSEFKELYIKPTTLVLGSTRIYSYPTNFKYPGVLRFVSTTYGEVIVNIYSPAKSGDLDYDPFVDKSFEPYVEMTSDGFYFYSKESDGSDISSATLSYLKQWTEASWGDPTTAGSLPTSLGTIIYVETGSLIYKATTYNVGSTFTTDGSASAITGAGTGAVITNPEISDDTMRECVRKAAYYYLVAMDQLKQAEAMMIHEANS